MSPRAERQYSSIGMYHIGVYGNDNEDIFPDDEDKRTMQCILYNMHADGCFSLFAYCIVSDGANFVIKLKCCGLADLMKSINLRYASYFNKKYSHRGHVFKDRYKSEPIENGQRKIATVQYIHFLPVLKGESGNSYEYEFSSCREWTDRQQSTYNKECSLFAENYFHRCLLVPFVYPKDMFTNVYERDKHDLVCFMCRHFLEINQISIENLHEKSCYENRRELVLLIRRYTGYSIRKISDVLEINRGEVYKILTQNEEE